jgi:hypothetical protein
MQRFRFVGMFLMFSLRPSVARLAHSSRRAALRAISTSGTRSDAAQDVTKAVGAEERQDVSTMDQLLRVVSESLSPFRARLS